MTNLNNFKDTPTEYLWLVEKTERYWRRKGDKNKGWKNGKLYDKDNNLICEKCIYRGKRC